MSSSTAAIVGASSGVGRALAEILAERGYSQVVVSRDKRDLEALCRDLVSRYGISAYSFVLDLSNPRLDVGELYCYCMAQLGRIDALFVPAGYIGPHDNGLVDSSIIEDTIRINYLGVVTVLARFAKGFEAQGYGRIVGFTSIAAAVPRRRNMVYASAKAGLDVYLRGLRHYFAGTDVIVQGYALGYVDSAMTFGQKLRLPAASPKAVASHVLRNLNRDIGVSYFPRYWAPLTWILRLLPWAIYKRVSF